MRRSLILMFLLFVFVPLARGQVWEHVPCESRAIEFFLERRSNTIELIQRIDAVSSLDDLIAVTADYMDTSRRFAFVIDYCLEGFDIMWRLAAFLNDVYAGRVMGLLGVADEDNPFLGALPADRDTLQQGVTMLETILAAGEREIPETDGSFDGPDCHYEIMIFPVERALAHEALMAEAKSLEDIEDILGFSRGLLAWRDETWVGLPGCWPAFHYLLEVDRVSLLIAMQRTLQIAGVSEEDDPYAEALDQALNPRQRWFGAALLDERLRAEKRPLPTVFGIPTCSLADLHSFAHMPTEFERMIADAETVVTADDRLSFIQRQVSWRRRLWLQMPMCWQVLELSWLMRQISSDFAANFAMQYLTGGELETPYAAEVEPAGETRNRLRHLLERFEASLSSEQRRPKASSASIFTCGDDISRESFEALSRGWHDLIAAGDQVASVDEALRFAEYEIAWREGYLSRLPLCPEAVELGWWTALQTTSRPLNSLLELAGVPNVDNPYLAEEEMALSRWLKVRQNIRRGDPMLKESGPVSHSWLRHCSDADELAIGLAALKYEELLKFPRADTIDELADYSAAYLEWREKGFRAYPLCLDAHNIRLQFTQIIGDVIARRALDIDGRLYGSNPWRQLPNDSERFDRLTDALFDTRRAVGPPPEERVAPACTDEEIETASELANGIASVAQAAETLDHGTGLPAFHQGILDWRDGLMARLPQCAGVVELGWLMNDISIDLAVLHSLIFVGADVDALPHPAVIAEGLARMSKLAGEMGIKIDADLTQ